MNAAVDPGTLAESAELIRVRGLVQGVGYRPTVWRLARRYGVRGSVSNDGRGVQIHACGPEPAVEAFIRALAAEAPPLARVESLDRQPGALLPPDAGFVIADSGGGDVSTGVVPDGAACVDCMREVLDPFDRRYRYPFANCTHCGPRLSIIESIPYDRANTTMRAFRMCRACAAEYENPEDRRFHAQPIACHACGPRAWLERADGAAIAIDTFTTLDPVDAVCTLLMLGHIVAIKGIGGFQLACDATNAAAVERLRMAKHREQKPFALMARDLAVVRQHCQVSDEDVALLQSPAAPIVLMARSEGANVAGAVAPGIGTLGFMLPNTPLHHLLLRRASRPIVLTSGNLADEPQCIDNDEARARLSGIAEYLLLHDREIVRRVDDSVGRVVAGVPQYLRRARGAAPAPLTLPPGFAGLPPVLAMGAELKNTFCLCRDGEAIVSAHMGDLEDARTHADYLRALDDYRRLFAFAPAVVAVDLHPEYLSRKVGCELALREGLSLCEVQHHHAHVAACMAENGIARDSPPILGIALDGLGYGEGGELWGGEFLLADYLTSTRMATFKPVALPGGEQAMREPWRNTYAHLMAEMGWARFTMNFAELELHAYLAAKPRHLLDRMMTAGVNSPHASSCGRLFDAVAAAVGLCRDRLRYEAEAAMTLEALVDAPTMRAEDDDLAYPFSIARLPGSRLPYVEPLVMWQALLGDLILATPVPVIAARFHKGLAIVIARMAEKLSRYDSGDEPVRTVALTGGVFQNRVLLEATAARLAAQGFRVLIHRQVPAGDGGLALGQAVIAAARACGP